MDALLLKQDQLATLIERFTINTNKTGKANRTIGYMTSRIDLLNSYFNEFCKNHFALTSTAHRSDAASNSYFTDEVFEVIERKFSETQGMLLDELNELKSVAAPATLSSSSRIPPTNNIPNHQTAALPRITIPKFTGNILEWPSFKDLFTSVVINNIELTPVQRLHYLKGYISGEAEELLRDITITAANYTTAWETLIHHYENNRVIVNTHLHRFMSISSIPKESSNDLKSLIFTTSQSVRALKNIDRPTEYWDDFLVFITVSKLDPITRKDWENSISENADVPSFESLERFLIAKIRTIEAVNSSKINSTSLQSNRIVKAHHYGESVNNNNYNNNNNNISNKGKCPACNGKHILAICYKFKGKSVAQRREIVQNSNCCFNCLSSNHRAAECASTYTCRFCNQRHNSLLHINNEPNHSSNVEAQSPAISSHFVNGNTQLQQHRVLLATALIMVKNNNGRQFRLRALLDSGSQATFITESAVQLLQLSKQIINVPISGISGAAAITSKAKVQLVFSSCTGTCKDFVTDALVLKKVTNNLPSPSFNTITWEHLKGIQLADPEYNKSSNIDIVLGADIYASLLRNEIRNGPPGSPIAQNTVLGWILSGKIQEVLSNPAITAMHVNFDHQALDQQLRRFWEIEEVDTETTLTEDEQLCEEIFSSTHTRKSNGQYVVRLPFKRNTDLNAFRNTRNHAFQRFEKMEQRLNQNSDLKVQYCDFMKIYETLGHMQRIQCNNDFTPNYYIPHHHVIKESSSTTKLRVVFDASSKGSLGFSLNDKLLAGPKLQRDLTSIILRWRMHRVVFIADIEKMFRQIGIHDQDADLQRIIWRFPGEQICDFKLNTVTYGTACAPYLAIRVLRQLAQDECHNYPQAAATLDHYCYVDDILSGSDDVPSCQKLQKDLIALLKCGSFTLKKWSSNHPHLLNHLPSEFKEECSFDITDDKAIKALGLFWSPNTDSFGFKIRLRECKMLPTKRSMLSDTAQLYDPLGWISPVIIKAKIMLQNLWLHGLNWDDPLDDNLSRSWLEFRDKLVQLDTIKIPRWLNTSKHIKSIELHGFADASCAAYAAVVYVRIICDNGEIITNLVSSKTKVAPVKQQSLPRLELSGALLLSRLLTKVHKSMELNQTPIYGYTDSTIVLAWLNKHSSYWKTFVANRVAKIQSTDLSINWRHVRSADNPADCASRGISSDDLQHHPLWWHGPDGLQQNSPFWSSVTPIPETTLEEKSSIVCNIAEVIPIHWELINKYSSLQHLVRITAYCQRFVKVLKVLSAKSSSTLNKSTLLKSLQSNRKQCNWPKEFCNENFLTTVELQNSLKLCIKSAQQIHFAKEISDLSQGKEVRNKSCLIKFNPFIDSEGIVRVGGRLRHSNLQFNKKHPAVLPKNATFTTLVISSAHAATLHGGATLTLSYIRDQYWIIDGRNKVRHFVRQCVICYRFAPQSSTQIMADLPRARVVPSRPFLHTGVDYAGPIDLRASKGRGYKSFKAYISVFVCFATKAVHLELVTDQTTDAFITAYRRFTSRRGICSDLYSDQGTNFVGAKSKLTSQLLIATRKQSVELFERLATYGTQWHFNPPGAPHFGGLWESAVKSTKYHIKRVIGLSTLTYEEMSTLLCQVEACLNSRPLCPLTGDVNDMSHLTPSHFLIGEPLCTVPEPNLIDVPDNRLNRWQLVQKMYQNFWNRWSTEYLNIIQQRNKWQKSQPDVKIGDMVLVRDERISPCLWPLGRVIKTFPGSDNKIRIVTIQTKNSIIDRPIVKVCVLPINESQYSLFTELQPPAAN